MRWYLLVAALLGTMVYSAPMTAEELGFSAVFLANERVIIAPDESYDEFLSAVAPKQGNVRFTDQYRNPWVRTRPQITGNHHVLLVRVREMANPNRRSPCNVETGANNIVKVIENCSMPIDHFEFFPRTVSETLVTPSSFDGSGTLALYIGGAPEGDNGYEGMFLFAFISQSKLPAPKVKRISPTIPPSIEKQFARGYDAWSFDFGDGTERWLIYFSDFRAGPYYWLIENPHNKKTRKVRQARSVFGNC